MTSSLVVIHSQIKKFVKGECFSSCLFLHLFTGLEGGLKNTLLGEKRTRARF